MYSHQLEELARQRISEMRRMAHAGRARAARSDQGRKIRYRAGWTLVAIGLRIAESRGG
jgi:hypothetical protein